MSSRTGQAIFVASRTLVKRQQQTLASCFRGLSQPVAGVSSFTPAISSTQRPFNYGSIRLFSDKTEKSPPNADEKVAESAADAEEAAGTEEAESAGPSEQEKQLEAQVKELKDQLLRSLAEQDNTRRIARHDVDNARQFAIKSFAKSLLDVSDNLTRALEAVSEDDRKEQPALSNLYEGILMTEKGLLKAFEANGLVKYGSVGDVFDPNKHEALFEYADPEKQPGTVGQLLKPGFMLNERVLRTAEVGVVKKE